MSAVSVTAFFSKIVSANSGYLLVFVVFAGVLSCVIPPVHASSIETTGHWNNKTDLRVKILKESDVRDTAISIATKAVFSKETKHDKGVHFVGWQGALDFVHNQTKTQLPKKLVLVSAMDPTSDVDILLLSSIRGGLDGYTNNESSNGVLKKSVIQIYRTNGFSESELVSIVSHEFGHALGLKHEDCQCIMSPTLYNVYITDYDIRQLLNN